MKLFELTLGTTRIFATGNNIKEVEENKSKYDPRFEYLPVEITEVELPGYEIKVTKLEEDNNQDDGGLTLEQIDNMNIEEARATLNTLGIEHHPNTGLEKLKKKLKESL